MPGMFEVYRGVWTIEEWKGGAVYRTTLTDEGWFDMDEVESNHPRESGIIYGTPTSDDAPVVQIRKKRQAVSR